MTGVDRGHGTVVVGLGNPVLGDDGAGLCVAEHLARLVAERPIDGVVVRTSRSAGLDLLALLAGFDEAVVVDALAVLHPEPGRVRRLGMDEVAGSARLVGGHDVSLAAAFRLAAALSIPMPAKVTVYGIEVADIATFSQELTRPVAAAAAALASELHDSLSRPAARTLPP